MNIEYYLNDNKVTEFNTYFKREIPKEDTGISDLEHYRNWVIRLTQDALKNGQVKLAHDNIIVDDINIT